MQTFEQILNRVRDKSDKAARKGHQIWFRGQANATWPVKSSLHRYIESYSKFGVKPDQKLLLEVAKSFYHRFAAEAWPLLQYGQRDPWGVVFMMQHHDVPTRLLDWTASFGCALYFALGNLSSESPAIENAAVYMLIAEELNQRSIKKSGIVFLEEIVRDAQTAFTWPYHPCAVRTQVVETISVSPVLDNARMVAQQSRFLLCGDSFDSLEDQFGGDLVKAGILEKLVLTPEMFEQCRSFLTQAGIREYGLFPDLDGLARQIKIDERTKMELAKLMIKEEGYHFE